MNFVAVKSFGSHNERKTYIISAGILLLFHALFFAIFTFLGISFFACLNFIAIIFYAMIGAFSYFGYYALASGLSHLGIVAYSCISVLSFGWGYGFEYYILGLFSLLFFDSRNITRITYWICSSEFFIFLAVYFYSNFGGELFLSSVLPEYLSGYKNEILVSNLFIVCIALSLYQHLFSIDADVRLIELNTQRSYYEKLANYDSLTGILNRQSFSEIIKKRYENDYPLKTAVLVIDIDFFKQINDRFGHDKGDSVLMQVSSVLSGAAGESNLVCRWGGEEFVMDVYDINSQEKLKEYADSILSAVLSHKFEGLKEGVSVSIGGCFSKNVNLSYDEYQAMLHEADKNLYDCKISGRGMAKVSSYNNFE